MMDYMNVVTSYGKKKIMRIQRMRSNDLTEQWSQGLGWKNKNGKCLKGKIGDNIWKNNFETIFLEESM